MDMPQGMDSKFRFILIAAKRARQLQAGAKPLVQTPHKKATKISVAELSAGLVPYETFDAALERRKAAADSQPSAL
ncbi:MAG: DNA-directed RNA polymerase subunit omega [Terriglobia bacterium]